MRCLLPPQRALKLPQLLADSSSEMWQSGNKVGVKLKQHLRCFEMLLVAYNQALMQAKSAVEVEPVDIKQKCL